MYKLLIMSLIYCRSSDHRMKRKEQGKCIISDPSFSMVTVQREDSGITWRPVQVGLPLLGPQKKVRRLVCVVWKGRL